MSTSSGQGTDENDPTVSNKTKLVSARSTNEMKPPMSKQPIVTKALASHRGEASSFREMQGKAQQQPKTTRNLVRMQQNKLSQYNHPPSGLSSRQIVSLFKQRSSSGAER